MVTNVEMLTYTQILSFLTKIKDQRNKFFFFLVQRNNLKKKVIPKK